MTTAAKSNFGNKIYMDPAPSAATTLIGELLSVTLAPQSRAMIDVTTHDSPAGAQEFIPEGTYDPGEITFEMHLIGGSTADQAIITAMTSAALQNVKVHLKKSTGYQARAMQAYVASYVPAANPTTGKQTTTVTLRVTGATTITDVV